MIFLLILLIIIIFLVFISYQYYQIITNDILSELVELDKIFEARFDDLTKSMAQFQKYIPEQKNLIYDIQTAKTEIAKVSKPKTTKELAQKITNENVLTINLKFLLDKCDLNTVDNDLKQYLLKQTDYIKQINLASQKYNKLIIEYRKIKDIFPFNLYKKYKGIELDLDTIKTE